MDKDGMDREARAASMRAEGIAWQAHRGGGGFERPDNTRASFRYGWALGGIPEADIRRTRDGVIVCLHDPTLRRTTDAPEDIADLPVTGLEYSSFAGLDAGAKFSPEYRGERIPRLVELFAEMRDRPERGAYLDLKEIDLGELEPLIEGAGLFGRCIVAGPRREELAELKRRLPAINTMLWCGGSAEKIWATFSSAAGEGFAGLDRVQFHLNDALNAPPSWRYEISASQVAEALRRLSASGRGFEVLPWKFEAVDMERLLGLGVRGFATDEPERFCAACEAWIRSGKPAFAASQGQ
jgi:glycerophosphoryl diester phosphodiesterase